MSSHPPEGKKILLIDRSRTLTRVMTNELHRMGFTVEAMGSAAGGLLAAAHWHPDLIVSSVEVGEISGYDLCALLRLIPELAGVPVILISSSEADLLKRKAADAGADYYVHKDHHFVPHFVQTVEVAFHLAVPASAEGLLAPRRIRRVLVVDDSRVMRRIIRNILGSTGITEVEEAEHGVAALQRLAHGTFDLVITDWNMPVMDGLALVKAIRQDRRHASLAVAMVTTEGSHDAVAAAKAAGADGHLCKPFSVESLKRLVNDLQPEGK